MANAIVEIRANGLDSATIDRLHLAIWDAVVGQAGFTGVTKDSFTAEAGSQSAVAALSAGEVHVLLHQL